MDINSCSIIFDNFRKSLAIAELERHLLDVTCCQAIEPLDFKSNPFTNRRKTEEKSSWL